MKRNQKRNLPRLIIQWSVIVYLLFLAVTPFFRKEFTPDFEAFCPFGGILSLNSYLLSNSLACSMTTTQIAMGIMLVIGIILFSKLFCAYVCPIGAIGEWLGEVGNKYKIRLKLSGLTDKILRSLKYLLLFFTFYYTLESNELFCKKFDPFFAITSGFSLDVAWLYASLALIAVVIGSLLVRLFWCKYLCPLGAVSNIIKFTWFFAMLSICYALILIAGFQLSYVWPLAIACVGGYSLEIRGEKMNFSPLVKITRNESTCTNCNLCSRKCPQVIYVAKMKEVNAVDCNLCGECLEVCPEKDTLQMNKKSGMKWLPPVVVVLLFILGLLLSSNWELPTIEQKWGTEEKMQKASLFTRSGLSEINCFGSSMAFANKMHEVKGILGVATYVTSHKVKIYYDAALINERGLQAELFIPQKKILRRQEVEINTIKMVSCSLDNFFASSDFTNLSILLKEKTAALALESEFNCPVTVRIYFPGNCEISQSYLTQILETKNLNMVSGSQHTALNLSFKLVNKPELCTITRKDYRIRMFESYRNTFNWKTDYRDSSLDTLLVPADPDQYNLHALSFFVSHLSNDNGVVGFQSSLDSSAQVWFKIIYVDSLTNSEKIVKAMNNDTLIVNYEGGEVGKVANTFKFRH